MTRGISFIGASTLFLAEMALLLFYLGPSIELGLTAFCGDYSYLAPGRAILRDFKFRGHNIVFIKFAFLV